MKKTNIILICSILLNLVLTFIIYRQFEQAKDSNLIDKINKVVSLTDYNITSKKNFDSIIYNKNDSLYKTVWSEAFEEHPEMAFLISCTYYYITKEQDILKDIDISSSQLNDIYNKNIEINK